MTYTLITPSGGTQPLTAPANASTAQLVLERQAGGGFAAAVATWAFAGATHDALRETLLYHGPEAEATLRLEAPDAALDLTFHLDLSQVTETDGLVLRCPSHAAPAGLRWARYAEALWDVQSNQSPLGLALPPAPTVPITVPPKRVAGLPDGDPVVATGMRLADLLPRLGAALGLTVASDYFATGPGAGFALVTGYAARGVAAPLALSLAGVLAECQRVFGTGWGYDPARAAWVVEPLPYYYRADRVYGTLDATDGVARGLVRQSVPTPGYVTTGSAEWGATLPGSEAAFHRPMTWRLATGDPRLRADRTSGWLACDWALDAQRRAGASPAPYDAGVFVVDVGPAAPFILRQGLPEGSGVPDPATTANWRLSPAHSLLRQWAALGAGGAPLPAALLQAAGVGLAHAAAGPTAPQAASVRGQAYAEPTAALSLTQPLPDPTTWADPNGHRLAQPPTLPETLTLTCTLPLGTLAELVADPHGLLRVQLGSVRYQLAFLDTLAYRLADGQATLTLRPLAPYF
ncbi:MAG: hypothetical protein SFY70_02175 [Bacteroidia bacterium]|nr:hypothetical protein [Bacteroidia bacterium]